MQLTWIYKIQENWSEIHFSRGLWCGLPDRIIIKKKVVFGEVQMFSKAFKNIVYKLKNRKNSFFEKKTENSEINAYTFHFTWIAWVLCGSLGRMTDDTTYTPQRENIIFEEY